MRRRSSIGGDDDRTLRKKRNGARQRGDDDDVVLLRLLLMQRALDAGVIPNLSDPGMIITRNVETSGLGVAMMMTMLVANALGRNVASGVRHEGRLRAAMMMKGMIVRLAILAGSGRRAQAFMGAGTAASPLVAIFKTSSLGVAMMRTLMAANSLGSDGIGHVRHGRVMMGKMMAATFGASSAAAEGHAALAGDNRRVREKTRAESAARPLVTITLTMMMDRGGGRGRGLAGSPRLGASQAKAPQAPPTSEPSDTGADVATGTTRRSVHIKGAAPRSHALDGAVGQRVAGGGGCEAHFRFHANVWAGVGGQRHNSQFAGPSHGRRGRGSPTRRALLQAPVAVRHHTSIAHGAERAHGTTSFKHCSTWSMSIVTSGASLFASTSGIEATEALLVTSVGRHGGYSRFTSMSPGFSLGPSLSTGVHCRPAGRTSGRVDDEDCVRGCDWLPFGARRVRQVGRGRGG